MPDRRVTLADVARAAGVSPSTVSVVFSGKTPAAEATRARVLDAAATLGYVGPDPRAASLRTGRSGIVGVVFGQHLRIAFSDPVNRHMMDGLAEGVAGAGLLLLHDDEPTGSGVTVTTAPMDAAVLIGFSPTLGDAVGVLRSRNVPVVVIEGDAGAGVPRIELDNRDAQRQAASHLRSLGHQRVATVTLPLSREQIRHQSRGPIAAEADIPVDVTRERLAGAREIFPDLSSLAAAESSIDEGMLAGRMLFAGRERPTAVIAQSDLLAAGVIRAAEELGLRVPDDVSVTGFDGIAVDGLGYRLTTMVQPATEKGLAAGRTMAALLAGDEVASIRFTCEFREGNTTAPAPAP